MKELEGRLATDMDELSSSAGFSCSKSYSQSSGSPVQLPDGQRKASTAEHFPSQLAPSPQVVNSMLLFVWQQVTTIDLLAFVKVFSKKAFGLPEEVVVGPGIEPVVNSVVVVQLGSSPLLIIPHSFNDIVVFTCAKICKNGQTLYINFTWTILGPN